jgi:hypothetical protein
MALWERLRRIFRRKAEWDFGVTTQRPVTAGGDRFKLIAEESEGELRVASEVTQQPPGERVVLVFEDGEQASLHGTDPVVEGLIGAADEMISPGGDIRRRVASGGETMGDLGSSDEDRERG